MLTLSNAMGELRDKLRANLKFPRRHSGLAHLSATKSNTHSISESESPSRPLSQCTTNPRQQPSPFPTGEGRASAKGRQSSSRDGATREAKSSHSQATTPDRGPGPTASAEARDTGVRHEETKQEITATPTSADVRRARDEGELNHNNKNNNRNCPIVTLQQPSPPAAGAPLVPAAADSTHRAANDATNGSMHSTDPATSAPNVNGNDQRSVAAKLASIHEVASDDSLPANTNTTKPFSDTAAAAAAASADAQRRAGTVTASAGLVLSNPEGLGHSSTTQPSGSEGRSLLPTRQSTLIRTLLNASHGDARDPTTADLLLPISANMLTRKIWVKRPGASATLITISEDDLVDDVRDMILRRYANSLGRHFDAPDLTLRIAPREQQRERQLAPDEPMARTLDAYYPGGQTVEEALIIDIPPRRTPRASPRAGPPHAQHLTSVYYEDTRPPEAGTDYFGPAAIASNPPSAAAGNAPNGNSHTHAISVLSTGQVPQIPSPGGTRSKNYRDRPDRPRLGRQHTSSPTILNLAGHPAAITMASAHDPSGHVAPPAPPMPTPPAQEQMPVQIQRTATPPPRAASPRPVIPRPKKKKTLADRAQSPGLSGGVPPINVLIVEDNIINLRLLEAFIKRLGVRWTTAMNGKEAVTKWRGGGFHLVLMDIQLPIMNGLEATREIRRLERSNSIGAFGSTPATTPGSAVGSKSAKGEGEDTALAQRNPAAKDAGEAAEEDKLQNRELFKSPVIIVALTASSLQSDRHEALAAGCNDFLTKPITYIWLERKVKEWGCMQALIDPDGWRNWKTKLEGEAENDAAALAAKKAKKTKTNRLSQPVLTSDSH